MAESLNLIWSIDALSDIDEIAQHISRDSPFYARRVVEELFASTDVLLLQPRIGRVVPELGQPTIRERFIYSYRLIYEITPPALHILAVIHGKRMLGAIEDRFLS